MANPRVGMGIFILKDRKFLMFKRRGPHGGSTWSIPGGHVEFGESFEETARREVKEETGLKIKNIRFGAVTSDIFRSTNKHYVTVWMLSDYVGGEAKNLEPHRSEDLGWYDFNSLPKPLFLPWKELLKSEFIAKIKSELK